MKFKLDENFGTRTSSIFKQAGHDVQTILDESLNGASDQAVYTACQKEGRCLVTFDLDFSDVTRFPPQTSEGILVIRLPKNQSLSLLEALIREYLQAIQHNKMEGQLWIVEPDRIRIHQSNMEE
jgi:predicted nuclease of predicted toxin-antitoxin system